MSQLVAKKAKKKYEREKKGEKGELIENVSQYCHNTSWREKKKKSLPQSFLSNFSSSSSPSFPGTKNNEFRGEKKKRAKETGKMRGFSGIETFNWEGQRSKTNNKKSNE